jgi:hypothetical protein
LEPFTQVAVAVAAVSVMEPPHLAVQVVLGVAVQAALQTHQTATTVALELQTLVAAVEVQVEIPTHTTQTTVALVGQAL